MGLFDVLKGGVDTAINTASKMAGDRSRTSSTQSKNSQAPAKGESKKK